MLSFIFNCTDLMAPSFLENTFVTRAKDHFDRSVLSSSIITLSLIFMFSRYFVHLFRNVSNSKHSFIQRFQYILVTACTAFYFARLLTFFSVMFAKFGFDDDRPIRKWLHVSGSKSSMLSLTDVKCLLLTMLSIYNNSVCNASSCNNRSLVTAFKHLLVIFTRASIVPPIYGLFGGSSMYCVQFSFNSFIIFFRSSLDRVSLSSLSAQIKLLPLSLRILLGCPLLALKRRRAKIKLSADKSPTSSRWRARVIIHVKSAPHRIACYS